jgi:hypothetical protein
MTKGTPETKMSETIAYRARSLFIAGTRQRGDIRASKSCEQVKSERAARARIAAGHASIHGGLGVEAGVFGSLANGRFALHFDVDSLVFSCPPELRYRIEAMIEDRMQGVPFQAVYADELHEPWRSSGLATVLREPDLRFNPH